MVASIAAAACRNFAWPVFWPCQFSSIAPDRISEIGLAMFWPAISGAEPCAAWPIA
ncbi:hypothetical protein D3C71_2207990 [compost metagenome]